MLKERLINELGVGPLSNVVVEEHKAGFVAAVQVECVKSVQQFLPQGKVLEELDLLIE